MYRNRLFTAGLLILATATLAVSEQQFTVKGVLRDPAGRTVDDGIYKLTFDLYNVAVGGASLWTEIHPSVTVQHGVFGIVAGEITPLTALGFQEIYYLGISVEDFTQLEPRLKLAPTPYALGTIGSDNFLPSTGAAGIGEKAPVSKLDIDGNLTIGSTYAGANAAPADGIAVEGSVGVGTPAPVSKTDVAGNLTVGSGYAGTNAAPADGALIEGSLGVGVTGPTNKVGVNGNVAVGTSYAGTETAPANGAIFEGSVGIGTPSPNDLVELKGDNLRLTATVSGGNGFLRFVDDTGAIRSNLYVHGTHLLRLSTAAGVDKVVVDGDGDLGIGLLLPVNKLGVEGGAAVGAGYAGTSTAPVNGLIVEGKMGVGVVAPNEKLEVDGNAKVTGSIIFGDNASLSSANLGGTASSLADPSNALITADSDANGAGEVQLKTGNTTQMVIANDGRVGISNTAPNAEGTNARLRVGGAGHVIVDNNYGFMSVNAAGDYFGAGIDTHTDDALLFVTNGLNERMRIGANGSIGIGTSNPGWPLQVTRNVAGRQQIMALENISDNVGDGASLIFLANSGANGTGGIGSVITSAAPFDADVRISTVAGGGWVDDVLTVTSDAEVGINTTTPAAPLNVSNAPGDGSTVAYFQTGDATLANGAGRPNADIVLAAEAAGGYSHTITLRNQSTAVNSGDSKGKFQIFDSRNGGTGGTSRLTINEDGYLGLNDDTPGWPLHLVQNSAGRPQLMALENTSGNVGDGGSLIFLANGGSNGTGGIGSVITNTSPFNADVRISTITGGNWNNDVLTVTGDGRVGVQATSPNAESTGARLRVSGAGHVVVDNNYGFFSVQGDGAGFGAGVDTTPADDLDIWAGGAVRARVQAGGATDFLGNATYAASFNVSSDRRLKKNIESIDGALGKVHRLRGVRFEWREGDHGPDEQLGFIAQEVSEVLPAVVTENDEGYFNVNYSAVVPVLVEAVKEQQRQIDALSEASASQTGEGAGDHDGDRVQQLESENASLKADKQELQVRLNAMEQRMAQVEQLLQRLEAETMIGKKNETPIEDGLSMAN